MATKKPRRTSLKRATKPAKKAPTKKVRRAADTKAAKKPVKRSAPKNPDRRKGSELQGFIDLVMTNLLNQYHYGLLQQAFEAGYKKGLEDGLKEGLGAADTQAEVSMHDLKAFIRETDEVGIKVRKDDTIGNMTERERDFLGG